MVCMCHTMYLLQSHTYLTHTQYYRLTEADLTAVNDANRTAEEKRVGMMEKWEDRFAPEQLIESLLMKRRCAEVIETCMVI